MTDRIANLRALRKAEQNAHKDNDLGTWAPTADTLRHALYINCDALLDCAEELSWMINQHRAALHLLGCEDKFIDAQTEKARKAIAKLNGEPT